MSVDETGLSEDLINATEASSTENPNSSDETELYEETIKAGSDETELTDESRIAD